MSVSYLYCIAASSHDQGPCKIGISVDPDRRVRQLQTGHPCPLAVRYREPVDTDAVRYFEQALHRDLGYLRLGGEWFDIGVTAAVAQIQFTVIHYEHAPRPLGRSETSRILDAIRAIVDAQRDI